MTGPRALTLLLLVGCATTPPPRESVNAPTPPPGDAHGSAPPAASAAPANPTSAPLGPGRHLYVQFAGDVPVIQWTGTWGNNSDWVSAAPAGAPDNSWAQWRYLDGLTRGDFYVKGLAPGSYEARLYSNWPAGGFIVHERVPFVVGGAAAPTALRGRYLAIPASVVRAGAPFELSWFDAPGRGKDWVTVVPAGAPDNQWGAWTYTNGQSSGVLKLENLAAGDYEARIYFDWPTGGFNVMERLRFSAR